MGMYVSNVKHMLGEVVALILKKIAPPMYRIVHVNVLRRLGLFIFGRVGLLIFR